MAAGETLSAGWWQGRTGWMDGRAGVSPSLLPLGVPLTPKHSAYHPDAPSCLLTPARGEPTNFPTPGCPASHRPLQRFRQYQLIPAVARRCPCPCSWPCLASPCAALQRVPSLPVDPAWCPQRLADVPDVFHGAAELCVCVERVSRAYMLSVRRSNPINVCRPALHLPCHMRHWR